jgi:hypothetical protein
MKRVLLCAFALTACGDAGGRRLSVSLSTVGADARERTLGDATIRLSRAELAFGPAYFCASLRAEPEACPTALLELTDTVVIDGLAGRSDGVAELTGTSGEIGSAMFDYGISWLLSEAAPRPVGGVLSGHSARIAGELTRGEQSVRFRADIDVLPKAVGALALNAQRTSHTLADGDVLVVSVDPRRWLTRIDVDALFALDVDGDGEVVLDEDSQAYVALRQALQTSAPAALAWE